VASTSPQSSPQGGIRLDAQVLITIGIRGLPGRLLRQGTVSRVVRDFSLHALLFHAVDPDFLSLLASRRPGQYEEEKEIASKVADLLAGEHRVFINNLGQPINSSETQQVKVKDLLRQVPYPTITMYALHAKLEPSAPPERAAVKTQASPAEPVLASAPVAAEAPSVAVDKEASPPAVAEPPVVQKAEAPAPMKVVETPTQVQEAGPRRMAKVDALKERYRKAVLGLELRGLFTGNFGLEAGVSAPVRLARLSEHAISGYLLNANALRRAGEFERAIGIYNILIKHDPRNSDYHFLLGRTLVEMGRWEAARQAFRSAQNLGHEAAAVEIAHLEHLYRAKPS